MPDIKPEKKYDTVVSSGQSALNALLTMNGGASLAFLAFIGNALKEHVPIQNDEIIHALQFFIAGTFMTVCAFGTIFLTNCFSSIIEGHVRVDAILWLRRVGVFCMGERNGHPWLHCFAHYTVNKLALPPSAKVSYRPLRHRHETSSAFADVSRGWFGRVPPRPARRFIAGLPDSAPRLRSLLLTGAS